MFTQKEVEVAVKFDYFKEKDKEKDPKIGGGPLFHLINDLDEVFVRYGITKRSFTNGTNEIINFGG